MKKFLEYVFQKLFPEYVFNEGSVYYKIFIKPILLMVMEITSLVDFLWKNKDRQFSDTVLIGVTWLGIRPNIAYIGSLRLYFDFDDIPYIEDGFKVTMAGKSVIPLQYGEIPRILADSQGKYIEINAMAFSPIGQGEAELPQNSTFSKAVIPYNFIASQPVTKENVMDALRSWGQDPVGVVNNLLNLGITDFHLERAGGEYSSDVAYGYTDTMNAHIESTFFGKKKGDTSFNPNAAFFFNLSSGNWSSIADVDLSLQNELNDDQYRALWVNGDGNFWAIDLLSIAEYFTDVAMAPGNFKINDWIISAQGIAWGELVAGYIRGYANTIGEKWMVFGRVSWGMNDRIPPHSFRDIVNNIADDEYKRKFMKMINDFMEMNGFDTREKVLRQLVEANDYEALMRLLRKQRRNL